MGIFHPTGYTVAIFPDLAQSEHAAAQLHYAQFDDTDVIAVSGDEMLKSADQRVGEQGVWGYLMRELSAILGTEAVYTERDLNLATEGAGFAIVHCSSDEAQKIAWRVLEPLSPLAARHYARSGIQHLAGD
ncbi:MAG: hypothetical protein ABI823_16395 [Bryobacteraceae bacterium]